MRKRAVEVGWVFGRVLGSYKWEDYYRN